MSALSTTQIALNFKVELIDPALLIISIYHLYRKLFFFYEFATKIYIQYQVVEGV